MRLLEEIFSMLGGEDPARIAYTVSPGGGHFRNVKRVAEFSPQRIVFRGRRGGLGARCHFARGKSGGVRWEGERPFG